MARMGSNIILSLLLGVYLKVGAAGKAAHGADWNYRVNDMNLLDVLRNSTRISPQCAAALKGVRRGGNAASRAELFSGHVQEAFTMATSLFLGTSQKPRDLVATAAELAGTFSSLGKPETCRDYYLPGFHYCRIDMMDIAFRLGACLPKGCDGNDVIQTLAHLNRHILAHSTSSCGEHHYPASSGTYAMGALILTLMLAVLLGSAIDWKERQDNPLEPLSRDTGSRVARALKAFSLITNVEILLRPTKRETFTVLDGVRSLSILWVILGHAFILALLMLYPSDSERMMVSSENNPGFMQRWTSQVIPAAFLCVSCFLFMSAFLATYHLLIHLRKSRATRPDSWIRRFLAMEAPAIFIHRLLRLSPTYYFVMGVYIFIASTLITTTPYSYVVKDLAACHKYWWQNLLYVHNLRDHGNLTPCYLPSWYLSVDTQLFAVLPFLVLAASLNRYAGIGICTALLVASLVAAELVAQKKEWTAMPIDRDMYARYFDGYYIKPWYRAPAYLLGIISGVVWVEWGEALQRLAADTRRKRINATFSALAFAAACTLLGLTVYGSKRCAIQLPCSIPQASMSAFVSLSWPAFMIGVAIIIFLVFLRLDYGVIGAMLTWRPLILLARISFCVYLVHFGIMVVVMSSEPGNYPFSEPRLIFDYLGYVFTSVLLGLVLHLLVERPFGNLEAMLLPKQKKEDKAAPVDKTVVLPGAASPGSESVSAGSISMSSGTRTPPSWPEPTTPEQTSAVAQ